MTIAVMASVYTSPTVLAGNQSAIDCTQLSVIQMRIALQLHLVTSEQCVQSFLNRINKLSPLTLPLGSRAVTYTGDNVAAYNALNTNFPGFNAFLSLNANALNQAKQADNALKHGDRRLLLGIPISVNDPISVANLGLTNAWAVASLLPYQPSNNAIIVQNLINAGAIVIGKNNLHEFADGVTAIHFAFGPVRNAYDPSRIAGGDGGGNGTSIAARMVPAAVGNDLGGSVRIPAALNGVIGYRPSFGHYPDQGFNGLNSPFPVNSYMGTAGLMAHTVSDIVLLDSVMTGQAPSVNLFTTVRGLRLGVPDNYYQHLDPQEQAVVNQSLNRLVKAGAIIIHTPNIPGLDPGVSIPSLGFFGNLVTLDNTFSVRAIMVFANIYNQILANTGLPISITSPDVAASVFVVNFLYSLFPDQVSALSYYNYVLSLVATSLGNYESYFTSNKLDAIIYPTTTLPADTIKNIVVNGGNPFTNNLFDFAYTLSDGTPTTVTGAFGANTRLSPSLGTPSLTVPIGLTADKGLPVGMQIEGLPGGDSRVLEVGSAFEKLFKIPAPHSAP